LFRFARFYFGLAPNPELFLHDLDFYIAQLGGNDCDFSRVMQFYCK
jgi:hypothetical protein